MMVNMICRGHAPRIVIGITVLSISLLASGIDAAALTTNAIWDEVSGSPLRNYSNVDSGAGDGKNRTINGSELNYNEEFEDSKNRGPQVDNALDSDEYKTMAMLPTAHVSSTLELIGEVLPADHINIQSIEAMHILDSNPNELFFTTINQGSGCGDGTPASIWKMTLDPDTGKMGSAAHIQSLSQIQNTRASLFESSYGTLFTGGGWCGYKPAYYSIDSGNTWHTADSGSVYPPNSVFSFVEFKSDVYAGTGYDPYPGEVYRWLGSGEWEKVYKMSNPSRNIVVAMVVHDDQLFVGSIVYWPNTQDCISSIPVLVSSDGNTFKPTTGIPECHSIFKFLIVDNQLVTMAGNRESGENYMYHWNGISKTWEKIAAFSIQGHDNNLISHNGNIYAYGKAPDDAAYGLYQSSDLGITWQQIAVLKNPVASSMTIHDDTLYVGTSADTNNIAYIYRYRLKSIIPTVLSITPESPVIDVIGATRPFNIKANQIVNFTWYINGTEFFDQTDEEESSYTNTSAALGTWNVTVIARNANGTAYQSWNWNVIEKQILPGSGSISGIKFNDLNGNGKKDANESGLANWNIKLENSTGYAFTTTTNATGFYIFTELAPDNYTISEVFAPGWIQTFPSAPGIYNLTLTTGENASGIDFGNNLISSQSDVNATREIETEFILGNSINVTISISSNMIQALALQETIPKGWNFTRISDDADGFKDTTSEWVWSNVTPGITKIVIYRITAPAIASIGTYYINGTISNSSGMIGIVRGDNIINVGIFEYYRRLGSDPDRIETMDLLKAMDDLRSGIAPVGFVSPITSQDILVMIKEWAKEW